MQLLLRQCGDGRGVTVVAGHDLEHLLRCRIVWLARDREFQVGIDVIMPRKQTSIAGQAGELFCKGLEQHLSVAAVVGLARPGIEQRDARKQRRLVGVRQQANVAHRVAGCVQALQLNGFADLDDVTSPNAAVNVCDAPASLMVRYYLCAGGGHHRSVTVGVVGVLVCIEELGDLPAAYLGEM